jgi:hypothetical protein
MPDFKIFKGKQNNYVEKFKAANSSLRMRLKEQVILFWPFNINFNFN